jgi:AraC family transcriptional regulator of adaptative response/methylated-DNA-[protein]-cysteine methyltransferase
MARTYANNPADMWRAVAAHDRSADGQFVYAVRSTRIYCRPSCPARRPARRHVAFFPLPQAAERQGYRPCKRCSPRNAAPGDPHLRAVSKVCREIERQRATGDFAGEASLTLSALAARANMSPHQLARAFRSLIGVTPRQYADALRMRSVKKNLRNGGNVTVALYDAGFGSSSRLYERSAQHLGMTPGQYRRGGEGMSIGYAIAASPLGRLLVAGTERGISAVYLGKNDSELKGELRKEYPRAQIFPQKASRGSLRGWLDHILAHLKGKEPHLDLPTDVRATAFQRRVWDELRKIPHGKTISYTDLARQIGNPAAVRAVARACATNPTCIVVPCHRVVRQGGNLAGYRWGVERKRALLDREASAASLEVREKKRAS